MNVVTRLLVLTFINLCRSDCVIDHRTLSEEWEKKLHDDLRSNFTWEENPNRHNVTEVQIWFVMKYFQLDKDDTFSMSSWTNLEWVDDRLTWDPSKYGDMKAINFVGWIPSLELKNGMNDFVYNGIDECKVTNVGKVLCVTRGSDSARCQTRLTSWPYDIQRCRLEYGISPDQKNVRLVIHGKRVVTIDGEEHGSEWTIVDYDQEIVVNQSSQLFITFKMERNGEILGAIIIFPSVLLSLLTAATILLDVRDNNRLLMMMFVVMCHCFYLSVIGWEIPKYSPDIPTILLFYRFSIVYNIILLALTVLLIKLRNKASVPPMWVGAVSNVVLESHAKYFLWPRWKFENEILPDSQNNAEAWTVFANTINSVSFFCTVFVYSVMMPALIPTSEGLAAKMKPESFLH